MSPDDIRAFLLSHVGPATCGLMLEKAAVTAVETATADPVRSLKDFVAEHPVDRERVDVHKERMLAEVRVYRLREQAGLTQAQLAERIGVGQRQVSKIERGDLDNAKVGTIRSYLEAIGGGLAIEYVLGDQRIQVA
ncbi:helix-turn-helix domain-containing protein [Brevibacterium luteolum]|uniref:helix-turn-helix domain-containing protein n=4 Tax=Brevibacterium luteolum TaxID=199591 RepID=UPI00223B24BB|nr:helix-turn-helix transcriptional regulator [Brevibacterium luteolum]MCT1893246.1 helix-turn-helix domain-containing protein [Brevibacterium luteolum]